MAAEVRTQVLDLGDGTEEWRLTRCRLAVRRGPDKGRALVLAREQVTVGTAEDCDLVLTDPAVSRRQFEIGVDDVGFLLRDRGSTNGTLVDGVRVREAYLAPGASIAAGATTLQFTAQAEHRSLPLSRQHRMGELLGHSKAMRSLFAVLERAAPTDVTVLIEGESGTGKELVARELHRASTRREQPFVIVDSGAIPENLIEAELFGYEKGAFTGATEARPGAFAEANGGSVFLDEIGELPLEMQSKLLRVLEQREVKRLGSHQRTTVDVRVIAATNRNLEAEVAAGRFRSDLFFRLAVCRLWVAPLRQRPEDIEPLARHFLAHLGRGRVPDSLLTPSLLAALARYDWPGNARELRNVIERLVVFPDLPPTEALGLTRPTGVAGPAFRPGLDELPYHEARRAAMDEFERRYFTSVLEAAGGVVTRAAVKAGIPRQSFHRFVRRLGLRGE